MKDELVFIILLNLETIIIMSHTFENENNCLLVIKYIQSYLIFTLQQKKYIAFHSRLNREKKIKMLSSYNIDDYIKKNTKSVT